MNEAILVFLSLFCGAFITFLSERHFRKEDGKVSRTQNSTIIANDLESIKTYFDKFMELEYPVGQPEMNIRYYTGWQDTLAQCTHLSKDDIKQIYDIYDLVYDYNYAILFRESQKYSYGSESSL